MKVKQEPWAGNTSRSDGVQTGGGAYVRMNPLGSELVLRNSVRSGPQHNTVLPPTLALSNSGGGSSLPFTATTKQAWLKVTASGDRGSSPVTIQVGIGDGFPVGGRYGNGVVPGLYTATISISAGAAGSVNVPVSVLYEFGNGSDVEWPGY